MSIWTEPRAPQEIPDDPWGADRWLLNDPVPLADDIADDPVAAPTVGQSLVAEAVVAANPGRLMFVPGVDWFVFDGTCWRGDAMAGKRVDQTIVRTAQRLIASSANVDAATRKAQQAAANRVLDRASELAGVKAFLGQHADVLVGVDDLDADPLLVNCRNGTLDLRTGVLRAHDPSDRITKAAGCGYDPAATAPTWDRFLAQALAGHPGLREALAQCVGGVGLSGLADEHLLPILYGPGGGGKSTFVEAVLEAMGEYALPAAPELLLAGRGGHPTNEMDLHGARLAVCSEIAAGAYLNVAAVKRLTGDRFIKARHLYKDYVTFRRSHLLVMVVNDLPRLPPSPDDGIFRRVRVIPFTNRPAEPDRALPDKLRAELPGILRWLVDGYQSYARNGGIAWPESVTEATGQYRAHSDLIGAFIDAETIEHPVQVLKLGDLHRRWTRWVEANAPDARPGRVQDFVDDLAKRPGLELDLTGRVKVLRHRAYSEDHPTPGMPL